MIGTCPVKNIDVYMTNNEAIKKPSETSQEAATRDEVKVRYDLICGEFMKDFAEVLGLGAKKYGDRNWQKNRMTGDKDPVNHALKHLFNYQAGIPDDDGDDPLIHITHAAVNLMFEYWYVKNIDQKLKLDKKAYMPNSCVLRKKLPKL